MGCAGMGNLANATKHAGRQGDPLHKFPSDADKADLALSWLSLRQKDTTKLLSFI